MEQNKSNGKHVIPGPVCRFKISTFQCLCQRVFPNLKQSSLAHPHLEAEALIFMVQRNCTMFVQNSVTSNKYFIRVNIYVKFGYALCTGTTLPKNMQRFSNELLFFPLPCTVLRDVKQHILRFLPFLHTEQKLQIQLSLFCLWINARKQF